MKCNLCKLNFLEKDQIFRCSNKSLFFDANNHASTASTWRTISTFHHTPCMHWFDFLHVRSSPYDRCMHRNHLAETCKTFSMAVLFMASLAKFTNDFSTHLGLDRPILEVRKLEIYKVEKKDWFVWGNWLSLDNILLKLLPAIDKKEMSKYNYGTS